MTLLPWAVKYLGNKDVDQMVWNFNSDSLVANLQGTLMQGTVIPTADCKTPVPMSGNPFRAQSWLVINLVKLIEQQVKHIHTAGIVYQVTLVRN
jgi:hypothetical protein